MDRALKERTIGAVVLVAFAVVVVPVFLDGPADDEAMVSAPVVLPGQNDQPRTQQTIVLERDRNQPVPMAPRPAPRQGEPETQVAAAVTPEPAPAKAESKPAAKPEPQVVAREEAPARAPEKTPEKPAPEPAPKTSASSVSAGSDGMWAVQLGSFSNRDNAERLAANLRESGYAAFLSKLDTSRGELHRVRIGPQKDRGSAEGVAASLASAGHKGQVVTHP